MTADPKPGEVEALIERLASPDWWVATKHGGGSFSQASDTAPIEAASALRQLSTQLAEKDRQLTEAREVLAGDITAFPSMEAKAIEVANRISGLRGQPHCHPDPVMLLDWVEEINKAGLADCRTFLAGKEQA